MPEPDLHARLLDLSQPAPALTEEGKRYNIKDARGHWLLTITPLSWTRRRQYAGSFAGGLLLDNFLYENSSLEAVEQRKGGKP